MEDGIPLMGFLLNRLKSQLRVLLVESRDFRAEPAGSFDREVRPDEAGEHAFGREVAARCQPLRSVVFF